MQAAREEIRGVDSRGLTTDGYLIHKSALFVAKEIMRVERREYSPAKAQRKPWKRGSALRPCAFAGEIFLLE
jgi:hypothetical protein